MLSLATDHLLLIMMMLMLLMKRHSFPRQTDLAGICCGAAACQPQLVFVCLFVVIVCCLLVFCHRDWCSVYVFYGFLLVF